MSAAGQMLMVLAVVVGSGALVQAEEFAFDAQPGRLEALSAAGELLWTIELATDETPAITRWDGATLELADGLRVDRFGRIVGRAAEAGPDVGYGWEEVRGGPYWDTLAEITPAPPNPQTHDGHQPPFFDSLGNAWVFNTHIASGAYSLQVRVSDGHAGTWGPIQTISNTTNYVAGPEATRDPNDNVTVVFRDISGGYKLYAKRYTAGSGWGPLQMIYSTSSFFQAIEAGADELGNVVAIFDPEIGGDPIWTIAYDRATGTWGTASQLSPAGYTTMLPTIIRNRAGSAMYAIYLVRGGGPVGLYAHRWDSVRREWGQATFMPGTDIASYSGAGPSSRYVGVVDAAGNATLFWGDINVVPYASRYEGGAWQAAVQLSPLEMVDVENFGGADVSPAGDVFGALSRFEGGTCLYTFPYVAGGGWQPAQQVLCSSINLATRTRVCFYRPPRAVATMLANQGGVQQLTSILYDGSAWAGTITDIPAEEKAYYSDLAADAGEAVLVFEGEVGSTNRGIKATFLRTPVTVCPGDANCDAVINWRDIDFFVAAMNDNVAAWEAMFAPGTPTCPFANNDVNADGTANWRDIDALVALMNTVCP